MSSNYSRRFPNFAWAWPEGGRLLLLHAALNPNEAVARQALKDWLAQNDLDDAGFPEHRLFSAITTRFGRTLDNLPEYPRLIGLQRLNWTQSRLAVSANLPMLQAFVEAGLKVVLLKGAARIALNQSEQKSRAAYDLDLLLPDGDFETAVEMLTAQDWQSGRGESGLGVKARLSSVRARNFKKGRFGDIDVHRCSYQYVYANEALDTQLLTEAQPANYYGLPVFVPSAEERLIMAMGHGAWDGHTHSDWLVDTAGIIERETIDWDKLYKIAVGRRLSGPVAIALSFLAQEMKLPVPVDILQRFGANRKRARLQDIPALIMARDIEALGGVQKQFRELVHSLYRIRRTGRNKQYDTKLIRTFTRSTALESDGAEAFTHNTERPKKPGAGQWKLTAKLLVKMPAVRRRIELDVNGPERNLCHVQALHLRKKAGFYLVTFSEQLTLSEADFPVSVESLPSKFIGTYSQDVVGQKYEQLPIEVVSLELTQN